MFKYNEIVPQIEEIIEYFLTIHMKHTTIEAQNNVKIIIKKNRTGKFLVFLILSFLLMLPSFMAFDAHGSEKSIPTILFAYSIMFYPITYIVAIGLSWALFRAKKYQLAILASQLPWINIVTLILGIGLSIFFCGGQFVCEL